MSDDREPSGHAPEEIDIRELFGWAEFCAWSALVMTPIVWWLQGPSVSNDQFVVRTGMVVLSAVAAVGLRFWAIFSKH